MRVLCLHAEASSALQFSQELDKLEERLWKKYEIELVFVDGPLLDVQVGDAVGQEGGGINAIHPNSGEQERVSRRWYVEEESTRRTALPPTTAAQQASPSVQYSGLDASLLHLSQIWTRGGANISNNLGECLPFQGVMGIGQGADVAGLLPLLNYQEDEDDGDSEDEKENNIDRMNGKPIMFQGMQFVILIDGNDILFRRDESRNNGDDDVSKEELENDVYVGPDGVQSLHVMMEKEDGDANDDPRRSSSENLAKKYGPNATIHHTKQSKSNNNNTVCTPALSNIIGKFLITQKNKLYSNSKLRELISLQNQLANVEQLATLAIAQEIQKNPPKALMAVIGPTAMMPTNAAAENEAIQDGGDGEAQHGNNNRGGQESVKVDKAVGAWHGARRRGFGEEGGGAPCPGDFLLREEER